MLKTPYYLIDEKKLLKNLKVIANIKNLSGAKTVLALKCFATWSLFDLMRPYLDGTTSSSPYEVRLGREKFKKEVHAYSVAFSKADITEIQKISDKVIFNSISQLNRFHKSVKPAQIGLRINPGTSYSNFSLADPAQKYSRLGATKKTDILKVLNKIDGVMFHCNCENDNFGHFSQTLDKIEKDYNKILKKIKWVSLGGGISFTNPGYPIDEFACRLKRFSDKHLLQVYLEPGESVITNCAELVTTVLDIVYNEKTIAVIDASTEAHMLDLLIYRQKAKIKSSGKGKFKYIIAGRSCLAGDIFGEFAFSLPLKTGKIIRIGDAAGYTMVKKNWFNGLAMPSIAVKKLDGSIKLIRSFNYRNFKESLS
ncbi:MAG: carboxynorspermidine decarboxylase [Candidatus Omnitrophica bacterium]|nr:carboxynorspermidine decarboxylase [Candidatus Omnitrophota bacterium]